MLLRTHPVDARLPSQLGAVEPDEGVIELRSHEREDEVKTNTSRIGYGYRVYYRTSDIN